jgi:predicted transcriptional regulator
MCIAIILHMTKNNTFKGTTLLNHAVDTFMTISKNPDDMHLRDFMIHKNRFGGGSFTTFPFGAQGYTFENIVSDNNPDRKSVAKKSSKADQVLDLLVEPKTVAQIVRESEINGPYLNTILRQLVTEGKASKEGRGADATYIKV